MKYLKTYNKYILESLSEEEINDLNDFAENKFGTTKDDVENMKEFISSEFPYGLNNIPDKFKLYRILKVKDKENINRNHLGTHWVADKSILTDLDFLYKIQVLDTLDELLESDYELFIVTILTDLKNIDLEATVEYKARYADECEFTLISDSNLYIIEIEKINKYEI